MTVEQLNIIITAQTSDFQEKISAVNEALRQTISLSERAAAAAASVGTSASAEMFAGTEAEIYQASGEEGGGGGAMAPETVSPVLSMAADVLRLNPNQTLIGAVSQGGQAKQEASSAPIEIHTTVELDGDRLGEAIAAYNGRRSRITNGFSGS